MATKTQGQVVPFPVTQPQEAEPHLIIQRLPDESPSEWNRMIDEIKALGHATVTRLTADSAGLRWDRGQGVA